MRSRAEIEVRMRSLGRGLLCAGVFVLVSGGALAETAPAPKAAPAQPAPAAAPVPPAAQPVPVAAPAGAAPVGAAPAAIGIVPPIPAAGALPGLEEMAGGEFQLDVKKIRNPFKPFVAIQQKGGKGAKTKGDKAFEPKTPLQRFALEDIRFVGVVWSKQAPKGLVEDPNGRGYTVVPGTYIGDRGGKIVRIQPDRLVVEEYGVDVLGEESVREITIQLHKTENEVNP